MWTLKSEFQKISAKHNISGKTTCITNLIIKDQEYFVNIASLSEEKMISITKDIYQKIQDAWRDEKSVNLILSSLKEMKPNILVSDTLHLEIENPMDDVFTG